MGKKNDREAKARSKHGILDDTRIWTAENGWVTYKDGLITVKMQLTPATVIPLQEITELEFKTPSRLTRGNLRFTRAGDKFSSRQEMIFTKDDEVAFTELRDELERDRKLGVTGTRPAAAAAAGTDSQDSSDATQAPGSGQEFRAKYNIPADAVLARSPGAGYVSFDGHYVTIQHLGLGRFTVGKGVKRIPITSISSIQVKPSGALVSGFIQFSLPGGTEMRSQFGRQSTDAAGDENSMMIYGNEPDFLALRDAIETAQRELHQPRVVQTAPDAAQPDDVFAQLEKLGKLRDAGILTNEEFEAKKADLLAKM
ncbi:DUF4429 domain-containing protein [Arthrobacter sp. zg-Y40]|uniref:DUF4429 domain-containing protein n=1 Tax=Arthrobacter sp. zg-Y40 TaxID=2886939 RepID=UPI001D150018|nr:DUF4429 domain-containing protein [Arthrobacter sp. zg-Y40]MCC3280719.1 DUF4429 domain-containing protein [Arthrobacter sp. zg-Y40]